MQKLKKLIIIPAYNEEKRISQIITKIKSIDDLIAKNLTIAVIDDGSCDNTYMNAKNSGAIVLKHPFNMGYGSALQTGYKFAQENKFDVIVQMDGDGQHDPKYIPEMINLLTKNQNIDILIGSRFKNNTNYKTSLARKIGIIVFSKIVSLFIRKKITDATSGYKAIKSKVLPFLVSESFPTDYPDADLLIMLNYKGFNIEEFSMEMSSEPKSKSMHKGFLNNLYYIFKMFLSIFLTVISIKIFRVKS